MKMSTLVVFFLVTACSLCVRSRADGIYIQHDIVIDSDDYDGIEDVVFTDSLDGGRITVSIVDGGLLEDARFEGGTVATIHAGKITDSAVVWENAALSILGGRIGEVTTSDDAAVRVQGGQIGVMDMFGQSRSDIYGGSISELDLFEKSELHLYGTDLSFTDGIANGTLSDGTAIHWEIAQNDQSMVRLHTVPEVAMPTPFVLAVGLLWLRRRNYGAGRGLVDG